jgi:hypothetical protein
VTYTDELRSLSKAAWAGDTVAGERLLTIFAELALSPDNAHPELVRHLARCIGRIIVCKHDPRTALCIKHKPHRPKDSGLIKERNEQALHEYCKARGSGISHDAALNAAVLAVKGMTVSAMKHVYDNTDKFKRDLLINLYTP